MNDFPRLIEHAFPLKQASLDSVHEKNVRHGHISTLHIWPARRPLAACRAALIATLLPDPSAEPKPDGMSEEQWQAECARRRQELCEKIGGKVVKTIERKKMPNGSVVDREKPETEGGILHWGRETENAADLEWFRQEIRKAYGGRAPKVLDPFAGGGAIPLEAMRLGCETTAIDINPVAWFILKCTLEYPQKLAGQTRPLPEFILHNDEFMRAFFTKAKGYGKVQTTAGMKRLAARLKKKVKHRAEDAQGALSFMDGEDDELNANLAWHVRAWGQWVLDRARRNLATYYPVYADFEPIKPDKIAYERQPMRLVPLTEDGTPDLDALNADFSKEYLEDERNPRWVAKPTVAYLWARTVTCKNCRATIPLLKTRWLCKKDRKRVLLKMEPNTDHDGVRFAVQNDVPIVGGNTAQRREHDRRIGQGTMTRSGVRCPTCHIISASEDIRAEAVAGRLGVLMTAVVVDAPRTKQFRPPTEHEGSMAVPAAESVEAATEGVPFGVPAEPVPKGGSRRGGGSPFTAHLYGIDQWKKVFTNRQLLSLLRFVGHTREVHQHAQRHYSDPLWAEAVIAGLALGIDKLADRQSALCRWDMGYTKISNTFARFALPFLWDFCEGNPLSNTTGNYGSCLEWVTEVLEHSSFAGSGMPVASAKRVSAIALPLGDLVDAVVTDPPYYDAIPYSDLMDFFYVWLRRSLSGLTPELDVAFSEPLGPKWDHESKDGEIVDDSSRHGGDTDRSKAAYEDGMARAFVSASRILGQGGRLVIVFANKQPDAWETLVSAIIRAGFVVDGSWPIQTEMGNRTRALSSAALASSVWLVCRKRRDDARAGWDNSILQEMRANIGKKLHAFWDAGIRGPDFVWAAAGPALEAYSKHPVVKKANDPGQIMTVSEFLNHVRRLVVDYVVGQVLSGGHATDADVAAADRLDDPTAYYLLHRNDFGVGEAPAGTCILYAVSCGLSDHELAGTWDLLIKSGDDSASADEDETGEDDATEAEASSSGSTVKLKSWSQRKGRFMGFEAPGGRPVPLIDRIHRLMHLWRGGDVHKVDEYLDENALRRQELFKRVLQSLIELARDQKQTEELQLLESLSNHIGIRGMRTDADQQLLADESGRWTAEG